MKTKTMVVMTVALLMAAVAMAQQEAPLRKPLPENQIQLPDYFGLYAVSEGGTTALKDQTQKKGQIKLFPDPPKWKFGTSVEFIEYGHDAAAAEKRLIKLDLQRFSDILARERNASAQQVHTLDEQMQRMHEDSNNKRLLYAGILPGSSEIELLKKPIAGHADMLRFIPTRTLPEGLYQIGQDFQTWYTFQVGDVTDQITLLNELKEKLTNQGRQPLISGTVTARVADGAKATPQSASGWGNNQSFPSSTRNASESAASSVSVPSGQAVQHNTAARTATESKLPATPLGGVCPAGKLGEFQFGTKAVGYYDDDQLVDIVVVGKKTTQEFQKTKDLIHPAVDIAAPEGSELYSIADGVVSDTVSDEQDKNFRGLGYLVIVQHDRQSDSRDTYSLYLHMRDKPCVAKGDKVAAGKTLIGYVGHTGRAFGAHVHLEVRHFPDRLFPAWRNIYGIISPSLPLEIIEKQLHENWIDPVEFKAANVPSGQSSEVLNSQNASTPDPTAPQDDVLLASWKGFLL